MVAALLVATLAGAGFVWASSFHTLPKPTYPFFTASATAVLDPRFEGNCLPGCTYLAGGDRPDGSLEDRIYVFTPDMTVGGLPPLKFGTGSTAVTAVLPDVAPSPNNCDPHDRPGGRTDASSIWDDRHQVMWVFGGRGMGCMSGKAGAECGDPLDDRTYLDNIVRIDPRASTLAAGVYNAITPDDLAAPTRVPVKLPGARSDTVATWDGALGHIYGGQVLAATRLPDGTLVCPDGAQVRRQAVTDEIVTFDPTTTNVRAVVSGHLPFPLAEASGVYFPPTQSTYLFGGTHMAVAQTLTPFHHSTVVERDMGTGNREDNCFYYHAGPTPTIREGDFRLNTCNDTVSGGAFTAASTVAASDLDVGAPVDKVFDFPNLLYQDVNTDNRFGNGDILYLSDTVAPTLGASSATAFTMRLMPTGTFAPLTVVVTGDSDIGTTLKPMLDSAGFVVVDKDKSGTFTAGDSLYVGEAADGTTGLLSPGSVRLSVAGYAAGSQLVAYTDPSGAYLGDGDRNAVANVQVVLAGANDVVELDTGSSRTDACFYYHQAGTAALQVGDVRLASCRVDGVAYNAGSAIAGADKDKGRKPTTPFLGMHLAFRDNDNDGLYKKGDTLYLTDVDGPKVVATSTVATTLRLSAAGGTGLAHVVAGASDVGAPLRPMPDRASFQYVDQDGSGAFSADDPLYAGLRPDPSTGVITAGATRIRVPGFGGGSQVLAADSDVTAQPIQPAPTLGGEGSTLCLYLHTGFGATLSVGDVRLNSCFGAVPGSRVSVADTLELAGHMLAETHARLVTMDPTNDGFSTTDPVALTTRKPTDFNSPAAAPRGYPGSVNQTAWTLRLTPSGTKAAGSFVQALDAEAAPPASGLPVVSTMQNMAGVMTFDPLQCGACDTSSTWVGSQPQALGKPLDQRVSKPTPLVRMATPYGAFGTVPQGDDRELRPTNSGAASSAIIQAGVGAQVVKNVALPSPRNDTVAVTDGHQFIWILGGMDGVTHQALDEVLRYEPLTNTLVKLSLTMPAPRREAAAVHYGTCDGIYLFGGEDRAARAPWAASPSPTGAPYTPPPPFAPYLTGKPFVGYLQTVLRYSNCPPEATAVSAQHVTVGSESKVCVNDRDQDGNPVSVTFTGLPPGASVTIDPPCIVWTPTPDQALYTFPITVVYHTDGYDTYSYFAYAVDMPAPGPNQDTDGDGLSNERDNCPGVGNRDQLDSDGNGIGDACQRFAPGTQPQSTSFPGGAAASDLDRDGVSDTADNCPRVANRDQADQDQDGLGNLCDLDLDGDGIQDKATLGDDAAILDNCPTVPNQDQLDANHDGVGDDCVNLASSPTTNPVSPLASSRPGTPDTPARSYVGYVVGGAIFVALLGAILVVFMRLSKKE